MQCQITVFFRICDDLFCRSSSFFVIPSSRTVPTSKFFFILFQFLSTCLFTELVFTPHVWLIHSFFYVQVDYIQSHSFHLPREKLAERAKIALCQICDVSACYWLKSLIHIHQIREFSANHAVCRKWRRVVVVPKIKRCSTLEEIRPLNYKEKQQIRGSVFIMKKRWALLSKTLTFSSFSELNESNFLGKRVDTCWLFHLRAFQLDVRLSEVVCLCEGCKWNIFL